MAKTTALRTIQDLPADVRSDVVAILNGLLADVAVLSSYAQQCHWNIRGARFLTLHELFGKVYDDVSGHIDPLAERIAQLNGFVRGTVQMAAEATTLPDCPKDLFRDQVALECLRGALQHVAADVRKAIDSTIDTGDQVSGNLLIEIATTLDKDLWFVESHLQS